MPPLLPDHDPVEHDRAEDSSAEIEAPEQLPGQWAVIGGLATLIWTERYLKPNQNTDLGVTIPQTSKALALRGRRAHALVVKGLGEPPVKLHELIWKGTGRRSWTLASTAVGHPHHRVLEVTAAVPGLHPGEGLALRVTHRGARLHVLDPVSCLLAKTDMLRREQADNLAGRRKDALHVRLLQLVLPPYLQEISQRSSPSSAASTNAPGASSRWRPPACSLLTLRLLASEAEKSRARPDGRRRLSWLRWPGGRAHAKGFDKRKADRAWVTGQHAN